MLLLQIGISRSCCGCFASFIVLWTGAISGLPLFRRDENKYCITELFIISLRHWQTFVPFWSLLCNSILYLFVLSNLIVIKSSTKLLQFLLFCYIFSPCFHHLQRLVHELLEKQQNPTMKSRLATAFHNLTSSNNLSSSLDRLNRQRFRKNLLSFLVDVSSFMQIK